MVLVMGIKSHHAGASTSSVKEQVGGVQPPDDVTAFISGLMVVMPDGR